MMAGKTSPKMIPLKRVAYINNRTLGEETPVDRQIQYVDISNVDANGLIRETQKLTFETAPSRARRLVAGGDTIISTVRTYLKAIAYLPDPDPDLVVSTGFAVLTPTHKIDPRYLAWAVRADCFIDEVVSRSVGVSYPAIAPTELGDIHVPIHLFEVQRQIADYLDIETAKIDRLIDKKGQLLKVLDERRQALITEAVTRGLDPTVPMKKTGLPWLGLVPRDWEAIPIKYLFHLVSGGTPSKDNQEYWDGTIPWVSAKDMKSFIIHGSEDGITEEGRQAANLTLLDPGTILLVVRGMILAHTIPISVNDVPVTINQDMKALVPLRAIRSEFVAYQLKANSAAFFATREESAHGTKALRTDDVKDILVWLPTLREQTEIVEFVAARSREADEYREVLIATISLLTSRRSALIHEAVTGQITV